ncbi:assimilatory sulfite reductase (NADPH) flavoprotein subunit [Pseudogracilibacillus sp. SO30301A]|uniref:assimilatory sulfite reductase (NADPH) flavoprotein subunit n=1 Tax=Pseudogracilibacillus sp. SO30301A TaxID=3098291 RepID=UPI00300DE07D
MQLQVVNSPFDQEQIKLLNHLLTNLSKEQCTWLSGYLAAVPHSNEAAASIALANPPDPKQNAATVQEITVLYGSQTGNGQELAEDFSSKLKEQGLNVTLTSMNEFKPNALRKLKNLLIIMSTHGEGDPPDNALSFYEFLHGKRAPKLEQLNYSVLALGDSSYEFFCQTGKEFDQRLAELGATRICPRVDCDLDYDEPASEWYEQVERSFQKLSNVNELVSFPSATETEKITTLYSRKNPFKAEVLENFNLNGRGSNKETRHLELLIEGSNFQYEPGDSIGVYPQNDPELVDALITEMKWTSDELLTIKKEEHTLEKALLHYYEITVLTKPLLQQVNEKFGNEKLRDLLRPENDEDLKEYIQNHDLLDLVKDFSLTGISSQELISLLRKMPARLYSIASSHKANPDEVHLTIGTVRYHAGGRQRNGVCSAQCAERVDVGDTLNIYVHRNPNFRLPADSNIPIIMIGPGTGVAPYRSFLEEREEIGAEGKTWLFFGDQHCVTDFIYQVEWQRWLKEGVLTRMDVAFSRDTDHKVYVQHRMKENSKELFDWLEEGAIVYVCGDEKNMAKDVHETLVDIIQQEGNLSSEGANSYLTKMQQEKRYQRDVY